MDALARLGQYLLFVVLLYVAFRVQDLTYRGVWDRVLDGSYESTFFVVENLLFLIALPILLHPGWRRRPATLISAGYLLVIAVVMHRLDVTFVGMRRATGAAYVPTLEEFWISLFLVTCGALVFGLAARTLPVFERGDGHAHDDAHADAGGAGRHRLA
jgi:Ni/Fe-hydrogenase subunit HybB-like protein